MMKEDSFENVFKTLTEALHGKHDRDYDIEKDPTYQDFKKRLANAKLDIGVEKLGSQEASDKGLGFRFAYSGKGVDVAAFIAGTIMGAFYSQIPDGAKSAFQDLATQRIKSFCEENKEGDN